MDDKPPSIRPQTQVLEGGPSSTNGNKTKEKEPRPGDPEFDSLPQAEQIRRSIVVSFLAVEHSLEALETVRSQSRTLVELTTAQKELAAAQRDLTSTVGPLVLQVNALISDWREMKRTRTTDAPPPFDSRRRTDTDPPVPRAALHSYSELPSEYTDGGTQRYFATREQLREIARAEFKKLEKEEALVHDARPWRWVRGKLGPKVFFFLIGGALTGVGAWIWSWLKTFFVKH
jgi:hypothetical protein